MARSVARGDLFLSGAGALSRTRLNLLRSGWVWERVPIGRSVGARWITYTLLLLVAAVIIALVLPTHYSLGLLGTLGYLLNFVIALIQTIFYAILAIILNLLSRLFPDLPPGPPLPSARCLAASAANIPPPTSADFIQSLIFWVVFVIVAGYVVIQFLRQHPGLLNGCCSCPACRWWCACGARLRDWFGGLNQQIEDLREARRRARRPDCRPIGFRAPPVDQSAQTLAAPAGAVLLPGHAAPRRRARPCPAADADALRIRPHAGKPTSRDRSRRGWPHRRIHRSALLTPRHSTGARRLVRRYWERIKRALGR